MSSLQVTIVKINNIYIDQQFVITFQYVSAGSSQCQDALPKSLT